MRRVPPLSRMAARKREELHTGNLRGIKGNQFLMDADGEKEESGVGWESEALVCTGGFQDRQRAVTVNTDITGYAGTLVRRSSS